MKAIAHTRREEDHLIEQTVEEHVRGTAALAESFANQWGDGFWGRLAGMYHDLGKSACQWQEYLRVQDYDESASSESSEDEDKDDDKKKNPIHKVSHSEAGAAAVLEGFWDNWDEPNVSGPLTGLAYAIAGHHAGLADWRTGGRGALINRLATKNGDLDVSRLLNPLRQALGTGARQVDYPAELTRLDSVALNLNEEIRQWLEKWFADDGSEDVPREYLNLWVRMLYSALVDADSLDTERFCRPDQAAQRSRQFDMQDLKHRFDSYMDEKERLAEKSPVNEVRSKVLGWCRQAGHCEPGFFQLTVPTGGGKTLASLAFALEHCLTNGRRRIIYAIPYVSIIEQTADVLRGIFGDTGAVLEHHSNILPERETLQNKLAAENWDAPIVVTTNVQLFESLLSDRRVLCRKIHNISRSVIILDEAQMLPLQHMRGVLSVLKGLVKHFGVTVLLCTATQPALTRTFSDGQNVSFPGLPEPRQIVPAGADLYQKLLRAEWVRDYNPTQPRTWDELADDLLKHQRVLAVVNRRGDCRELYEVIKSRSGENLFHLSADMCPQHRSDRIGEIKALLKDESRTVRVISTQLIEAGVDIDFPVVFRALCGLDSAVQAAGRANREGQLNKLGKLGQLYLFSPMKPSPVGLLLKGEQTFKAMLGQKTEFDLFCPSVIKEYFNRLYRDVGTFDQSKYYELLVENAECFEFQFRTFGRDFHMIDDEGRQSVFVAYGAGAELIGELKRNGANPQLLRALQRYSVSIPESKLKELRYSGAVDETDEGYFVQSEAFVYDLETGAIGQPSVGFFIR
ncbi:CRISPR-associated helicase/endonuclease Cas3 [Jonquetella anthropi]|uniref:CRISPR-associated helicase/endonuclease Cas3 n=1 Tax=Jonquetella anthropi TaxID=428712 RepID=UPI00031028CA|nr:CRISPR-associated helicase/endonuclease Cas3 [Jonquetella anthropi]